MYLEYFKLEDYPFRLTPDPSFLYLSKAHSRAKAYMDYSLWQQDSFIVITGEIGSGKTTLIESMLAGADRKINVARVHHTQLDEDQFLQSVLVEFGFKPFKYGKVELLKVFADYLKEEHDKGRRAMLIVDEAQNLSPRVLEEVRLLSGLETHTEKLINVLLVGQPELNDTLDSPGLEQLVQRIRLRFHLKPLTREEVNDYIEHRMKVAGGKASDLFAKGAYDFIYKYTGGIPRLINLLCDTALMGAFVDQKKKVSQEIFDAAIEELQWKPFEERRPAERREPVQLSPSVGVPPKLIVTCENELIGEYLLDRRTTLIGRAPNCDIRLDDGKVSGTHAQVVVNRDDAVLSDLGSTNGTFVDGRAVKRVKLQDGGEFNVTKKYHFEFRVMRDYDGGDDTDASVRRDDTVESLHTDHHE